LHGQESIAHHLVSKQIVWLMGWPAGLKLNLELATFMGQLFLFYNAQWLGMYAALVPVHGSRYLECACVRVLNGALLGAE